MCHHVKLHGDWLNHCCDWRFFDFSKWRPSTILDLLNACLDHPQRACGSCCHCAKFGWNRSSRFDKMQLLIFHEFRLKIPVLDTKIVFGGFYPLNEDQCHLHPKRHFPEAAKYIKTNFFWGSALDPAGGAYSALQTP